MPQPTTDVKPQARTTLLLTLVIINIILQLINASLIKLASIRQDDRLMNLMLIFMFVMILGLVRLMVWGAIHKRFPVSTAYPITALFFPCLLILAWLYGEHISLIQITGASLVVAGVVILLWRPARESLEKSELL